jgi:hypothetical protein
MPVHSWIFVSEDIVCKKFDKVDLLRNRADIPIEIRPFFINGSILPEYSIPILLILNNIVFTANIEIVNKAIPQALLCWEPDLSIVIKSLYPDFYTNSNSDSNNTSTLKICFNRHTDIDTYYVDLHKDIEYLSNHTELHDN